MKTKWTAPENISFRKNFIVENKTKKNHTSQL